MDVYRPAAFLLDATSIHLHLDGGSTSQERVGAGQGDIVPNDATIPACNSLGGIVAPIYSSARRPQRLRMTIKPPQR